MPEEATERKEGCSGLGAQGMSALVPGIALWRTRVKHELGATEAFNEAWEGKRKTKSTPIPDSGYKEAMARQASLRQEILAAQASPAVGHGPRGLPDRPTRRP